MLCAGTEPYDQPWLMHVHRPPESGYAGVPQWVGVSVRFEIDSFIVLKDSAERGYGCTILPRSAIKRAEGEGRLASAALRCPTLRRQVVLALRPGPDPDRATQVVLALLDSLVAIHASAGDWMLTDPAG